MNIRDLQYLLALEKHKHFGRAAEASFVSQPTLSTQIRKLEDELGVKLVERTNRQALLTHTGREIAQHAQKILDEVRQIKRTAEYHSNPETGSVRLGIFPTLCPYLLPHTIPAIHAKFPQLELLLSEEKTQVILNKVNDGRLDACIVALPLPTTELCQTFLFAEPFVLAVPANHALATHKPIELADLNANELLLLEEGHCLRDQALDVCHMAGAHERNGFRATSLETLRQMVASGVGITLLPTLAVKPPVTPTANIRLVAFHAEAPHRQIAMVWRHSSPIAPFLQQLAKLFAHLPQGLLDPATAIKAYHQHNQQATNKA